MSEPIGMMIEIGGKLSAKKIAKLPPMPPKKLPAFKIKK